MPGPVPTAPPRGAAAPLHLVVLNHRDPANRAAGGAERYLHEIFGRLAAAGHRVTFLAAGFPGAPAEETGAGGSRILRGGGELAFSATGAFAAARLARRETVDLFVECLCKTPFFLPPIGRRLGVPVLPVVLHLFGDTIFREAGVLLGAGVWLSERAIAPLYRRLPFVALSDSTARDLDRRGIEPRWTRVVPPGLDLAALAPPVAPEAREAGLVVHVGRMKRYKEIDLVLRAFPAVRRRQPAARLLLVGDGDDRPRLERIARETGLGDAVRFVGHVSEEEKIRWLRRAELVVYPSPKEGWGISTSEAAACGTPVVASDSDGLRDAVQDGVTGRLVPHDDVAAWGAAIGELLASPATRQRLGSAARESVAGQGWDARAAEMLAAARQAVAERGA